MRGFAPWGAAERIGWRTADSQAERRPSPVLQWFHFAPDLEVNDLGDGRAVAGIGVAMTAVSLLRGATWSATLRGQQDPLQGWWSPRANVLEPATAIALRHPPSGDAVLATLFAFDGAPVPDLAFNRVVGGSGSLRWTHGGVTHTLVLAGLEGNAPTVRYTQ